MKPKAYKAIIFALTGSKFLMNFYYLLLKYECYFFAFEIDLRVINTELQSESSVQNGLFT